MFDPRAGYFTKRLAEDWLRSLLEDARRGTLPELVKTGATFADAAAEYLRYIEVDRGRKPSTLRGYRSAIHAHLLPAFGDMPVEEVTTTAIERWVAGLTALPALGTSCSSSSMGAVVLLFRASGLPGERCGPGCSRDRFVDWQAQVHGLTGCRRVERRK